MKGKLVKTKQGKWMVGTVLYANTWSNYIPLHPYDVKQINADAQVFDNIEARIAAYSDVEFDIVKEYTDSYTNQVQKYAKLIHHSVDTNEMVEDDEVEKLAIDCYTEGGKYGLADDAMDREISYFAKGYNKAKSSLYTQEDIDNLLSMYTDDAPVSYVKRDYKKYLPSLKQPKQ